MIKTNPERAEELTKLDTRTAEGNPWFESYQEPPAPAPLTERTWGEFIPMSEEVAETLAELRIRQVAAPIVAPIFEDTIDGLRGLPRDESHDFGGYLAADEVELVEDPKARPLPRRATRTTTEEVVETPAAITEGTGYFEAVTPVEVAPIAELPIQRPGSEA